MSNHKHNEFCIEYGCEQLKEKQEMSSFGAGVNYEQPMPKKNDTKPIWETVVEEMKQRVWKKSLIVACFF